MGPWTYTGYYWPPDYSESLGGYYGRVMWLDDDEVFAKLAPAPGAATQQAAEKLAESLYPEDGIEPEWWNWNDINVWTRGADDFRLFLQNGGFPKTAPAGDSVEFRMDVEALKSRFASCESTNQQDPNRVLTVESTTAGNEWRRELDGQAANRATIVAAEVQASSDLLTAAVAMCEAVGQSWVAGQLVRWQTYWLKKPKNEPEQPTTAQFNRVKKGITDAQAAAQAQLNLANAAVASAKKAADSATAAANSAAAQATAAAQDATKAKAAQARAETAERTARDAAADAKRKRVTAEQERDNAAAARRRADAERAKAADAQARAQQQQQISAEARRGAEAAGQVAGDRRQAAGAGRGPRHRGA